MTALVEKLRADIAEKDKRSRAMARALAEMKQEIITKAEKESESVAAGGDSGGQAEARRLEAAGAADSRGVRGAEPPASAPL